MLRIFLSIVIPIILSLPLRGQVVNIESERIRTDTTGWSGKAGITFDLNKYQETQVSLGTDLHLQYKQGKNLYLLLGDLAFISGGGEHFVNDGFFHLRYNRKLHPAWFRMELFSQAQYNELTNVDFRGLFGGGPRFKLLESDLLKIYAAPLYMFEYEEIKEVKTPYRQHRMSAYVSWTFKPTDLLTISSTTYYQPLLDDWSDHRISTNATLYLKISDKLSFKTAYNLWFDTRPPSGVPNTVYTLDQGLSLKLGK